MILTSKIVSLISHSELTSQEDRDQQQHVLVTQLFPDGAGLDAKIRLLHIWYLCTVASDHVLRLR
jgi:hypothetical protein